MRIRKYERPIDSNVFGVEKIMGNYHIHVLVMLIHTGEMPVNKWGIRSQMGKLQVEGFPISHSMGNSYANTELFTATTVGENLKA